MIKIFLYLRFALHFTNVCGLLFLDLGRRLKSLQVFFSLLVVWFEQEDLMSKMQSYECWKEPAKIKIKTSQDQDKARQDKTRSRQGKARQDKIKARKGKSSQGKSRSRQGKTRQGKSRSRSRQGKTRQDLLTFFRSTIANSFLGTSILI